MDRLSEGLHHIDSQDFMGVGDFVWWYGVVEDRKDPLYLGRVKVRCIGFHTDNKDDIPTDELPWAQVISPITSAGISGIGTTPLGIMEGSHVFGFFRDGREGQEPVVLGSCVGIPNKVANRNKGFFDPRSFKERSLAPYPPFFIERTSDALPATIVEFDSDMESYSFKGLNSFTKNECVLSYKKDENSDKIVAYVSDKGEVVKSTMQMYPSNPNENFMEFDESGNLIYSLPSTNFMSHGKMRIHTKTDRLLKEENSESLEKEMENTLNPFSHLYKPLYGVDTHIDSYNNKLHSNILTGLEDVSFSVPKITKSSEYPYDHITYTESGHIFELDDTPNSERVRLMHRSSSFLEFQPNGNRIDNVVGEYYFIGDSNHKSHILGNEIKTVEGNQNILINARGGETNNILKIKGKGNFKINSELGNVEIQAGEELKFNAKRIVFKPPGNYKPDEGDRLTQSFENYNLSVKDGAFINFDVNERIKFKSNGSTEINSGSLKTTISGMHKVTTEGAYEKSVYGEANEVYSAPLDAKTETAIFGSFLTKCINPLADIKFQHGPEFFPTSYLNLSGASGFEYKTFFGSAVFNLTGFPSNFEVFATGKIDLNAGLSARLKNLGATIELSEIGLISIKNNATSLKTILDKLLTALMAMTHPTGTGPSGPAINMADFTAIQSELQTLMF